MNIQEKQLCIIGKNINYSLSPAIYQWLQAHYQKELEYKINNLQSIDELDLKKYYGFNITIPFKQDICKLIVNHSENVKSYGCANIARLRDNQYELDLTDHFGLIYTIENELGFGIDSTIIVLGSGAMAEMIKKIYPKTLIVSRTKGDLTYSELAYQKGDLLINATPLGGANYLDQMPIAEELLTNYKAVFDLSYQPIRTKLLTTAEKYNLKTANGLTMLIVQALYNFDFWFETGIDFKLVEQLKNHLYLTVFEKKIIIGMPLAGKSSLASNEEFMYAVDLDEYIEKTKQMTINELIIDEQQFRLIETECLKELVASGTKTIIAGGGLILKAENMEVCSEYVRVFLDTPLECLIERLTQSERPLLPTKKRLIETYEQRINLYYKYADIVIRS